MTDTTRYAAVNASTGKVENLVVFEAQHLIKFVPDFDGTAAIGDIWNEQTQKFVPASPASAPVEPGDGSPEV